MVDVLAMPPKKRPGSPLEHEAKRSPAASHPEGAEPQHLHDSHPPSDSGPERYAQDVEDVLFRMLEAGALPFETMLALPQLLRGEPLAVALAPRHAQPASSCSSQAVELPSAVHNHSLNQHSAGPQSQPAVPEAAAAVRAAPSAGQPSAAGAPRRPSWGTERRERVASLKKEALPGWPLHGPDDDINEELSRDSQGRGSFSAWLRGGRSPPSINGSPTSARLTLAAAGRSPFAPTGSPTRMASGRGSDGGSASTGGSPRSGTLDRTMSFSFGGAPVADLLVNAAK